MDIGETAIGIIRLALAEDLGVDGDITTVAACSPDARGKAVIVSREPCVIAGGPIAAKVFELAGDGASYRALVADGDAVSPDEIIARVEGPLSAILAGERTALNFLCHLCGIATLTARLVDIAKPHGVKIMDTRKTNPGMRPLEKYAVAMGGGINHRQGLFDGVIIKDNHIAAAGGIEIAVRRVRNAYGDSFPIEVEATTLDEVREAIRAGADIVMFDNMPPEMIREALALISGKARTEVSGGVTGENLSSYVDIGVDAISLGFITHSAPASNLSLEIE
ncbi:MAG: nicotinate-nucleotide diphosphorylase (carboxylating) [Candidatus Anoxymicrobium japonicum]|uniref:Nicotinate-nucleotide pyrophosphorylase [carboxylating] n=1 Tax=Candidatus Anoxymicrobium japonicum TaxID=2013648 RepID=A0A2N3G7N0_9ACTN|nr:MAG: nicotinate-nucleotide diphosphorylase (carboxylating) [Candidatus Anoxymicrobium japonicum]